MTLIGAPSQIGNRQHTSSPLDDIMPPSLRKIPWSDTTDINSPFARYHRLLALTLIGMKVVDTSTAYLRTDCPITTKCTFGELFLSNSRRILTKEALNGLVNALCEDHNEEFKKLLETQGTIDTVYEKCRVRVRATITRTRDGYTEITLRRLPQHR